MSGYIWDDPRKKSKTGGHWYEIIVIMTIVSIICFPLVKSYFEMRTFNKFTNGPKATYTDALFSQLRVEANRAGGE
jgi:hypothetical protein